MATAPPIREDVAVVVPTPFYVGITEVTVAQAAAIGVPLGMNIPRQAAKNLIATEATWDDIHAAFDRTAFRLPSEVELAYLVSCAEAETASSREMKWNRGLGAFGPFVASEMPMSRFGVRGLLDGVQDLCGEPYLEDPWADVRIVIAADPRPESTTRTTAGPCRRLAFGRPEVFFAGPRSFRMRTSLPPDGSGTLVGFRPILRL